MNAIYTITTNSEKYSVFDYCIPTIKNYSKKVGADFINRQNAVGDPMFEKFFIKDLLDIYDRVLYVDSDILIRSDAPDIFNYYNEEYLYMYDETERDGVHYNHKVQEIVDSKNVKWKINNENYSIYNGGVILCSKKHKKIFNDSGVCFSGMPRLKEQTCINYNIMNEGISVKCIDPKFNKMVYFDDDGWFLHFANVLDRNERIKKYI